MYFLNVVLNFCKKSKNNSTFRSFIDFLVNNWICLQIIKFNCLFFMHFLFDSHSAASAYVYTDNKPKEHKVSGSNYKRNIYYLLIKVNWTREAVPPQGEAVDTPLHDAYRGQYFYIASVIIVARWALSFLEIIIQTHYGECFFYPFARAKLVFLLTFTSAWPFSVKVCKVIRKRISSSGVIYKDLVDWLIIFNDCLAPLSVCLYKERCGWLRVS